MRCHLLMQLCQAWPDLDWRLSPSDLLIRAMMTGLVSGCYSLLQTAEEMKTVLSWAVPCRSSSTSPHRYSVGVTEQPECWVVLARAFQF